MPTRDRRARLALLVSVLLLLVVMGGSVAAAATPAKPHGNPAVRAAKIERAISIAKKQIGDPWVWGMRGPRAFDCTGLVYYAFKQAHPLGLIGGRWRGVAALWDYAANRDLASRTHPLRGDLIVWGRAKHVGIYLGRGRAISALVRGVRIHRVHELYDPFRTYLHLPM